MAPALTMSCGATHTEHASRGVTSFRQSANPRQRISAMPACVTEPDVGIEAAGGVKAAGLVGYPVHGRLLSHLTSAVAAMPIGDGDLAVAPRAFGCGISLLLSLPLSLSLPRLGRRFDPGDRRRNSLGHPRGALDAGIEEMSRLRLRGDLRILRHLDHLAHDGNAVGPFSGTCLRLFDQDVRDRGREAGVDGEDLLRRAVAENPHLLDICHARLLCELELPTMRCVAALDVQVEARGLRLELETLQPAHRLQPLLLAPFADLDALHGLELLQPQHLPAVHVLDGSFDHADVGLDARHLEVVHAFASPGVELDVAPLAAHFLDLDLVHAVLQLALPPDVPAIAGDLVELDLVQSVLHLALTSDVAPFPGDLVELDVVPPGGNVAGKARVAAFAIDAVQFNVAPPILDLVVALRAAFAARHAQHLDGVLLALELGFQTVEPLRAIEVHLVLERLHLRDTDSRFARVDEVQLVRQDEAPKIVLGVDLRFLDRQVGFELDDRGLGFTLNRAGENLEFALERLLLALLLALEDRRLFPPR